MKSMMLFLIYNIALLNEALKFNFALRRTVSHSVLLNLDLVKKKEQVL